MSDNAEKLKAPARSGDSVARARLAQLKQRWGYREKGYDVHGTPMGIEVHSMGTVEKWEREGRDDGGWWFKQVGR